MKLMVQLLTLGPIPLADSPLRNVSAFAGERGGFFKEDWWKRKRNNLENVGFAEVVGWKVD
jgi:hypothetical protein